MLDGDDTMRNIQLEVAARGRVHDDHDGDAIGVGVTNQARALIWVSGVKLNQVGALAQLALDLVLKLIGWLLVGLVASVALGAL